jgi:MFS family permease
MSSPSVSRGRRSSNAAVTLQIVSIVFFTFLCYLVIGLPMAVLPGYVHGDLAYGSVLAGLVISIQYLATLLSRSHAGRMADTVGSKQTVLIGLAACAASGVLLLLAGFLHDTPALSLGVLMASRLVLGFGESWVGTGCITWAIGRVGAAHTAKVISWNGISTYAALAIGAPLGVQLRAHFGFGAVGAAVLAAGLMGFALAAPRARVAVVGGARMAFSQVVARVLPHGLGLGLASVGFGSIAAFITLYYAAHQWAGAALSLSVFGCFFIGARLLLGSTIGRFGGFRVAIVSISVEIAGLLLLWLALAPWMALAGAALAGFGFSLVFPSLGVEAVSRVPAGNRGAALGAYSAFLDLSLGITGPVAGLVVTGFGYPAIFLFAALSAAIAMGIALALQRSARPAAAAAFHGGSAHAGSTYRDSVHAGSACTGSVHAGQPVHAPCAASLPSQASAGAPPLPACPVTVGAE